MALKSSGRNFDQGPDTDILIFYNALEKILSGKGQIEDDGKDNQRGGSFGFRNAWHIEQAANFEFREKNAKNAKFLSVYCLILFCNKVMVHADKLPFFAFGCLGANKVPKKAKLVNSNNYINILLYKIFQLTSPKVE